MVDSLAPWNKRDWALMRNREQGHMIHLEFSYSCAHEI
jgi:hypothetical protein